MPVRIAVVFPSCVVLGLLGGCGPSAETSNGERADDSSRQLPVLVGGGFRTPESVVHDTVADTYLVSNIDGDPTAEDGNGFISRVTPEGKIEALRWVDGATEGVTLNAPKGMAIVGDTLYVTDISAVRKFDRVTGKPLGEVEVEGAVFLNDLAAAPDGTLYLSDTGVGAPERAAVFVIKAGDRVQLLVRNEELQGPNGLLALGEGVMAVNWEGGAMFRVNPDGTRAAFTKLPRAQLDGLTRDNQRNYLVSSWELGGIYRVSADGKQIGILAENIDAPADIALDVKRGRLLVPLFKKNQLMILAAD